METVRNFRYVVSLSLESETEPYIGMAELSFSDPTARAKYQEVYKPEGFENWCDSTTTECFYDSTEMVGIE